MSGDSAILDPAGEPVLKLDFEMPLAEHVDLVQQLTLNSRHRALAATGGVCMVALYAFSAGEHFGSDGSSSNWWHGIAALFMVFWGWILATNFAPMFWLNRRFSHGEIHTELQLDSNGICGLFRYRSGWQRDLKTKHISYPWRKVRKIHRPSGYVMLEFHGGGNVAIPERAFATYADVGQCLEWAQEGLAAQRKKPAFRHAAT